MYRNAKDTQYGGRSGAAQYQGQGQGESEGQYTTRKRKKGKLRKPHIPTPPSKPDM